ncbi:hypothetical protein MMC30_002421 [Trapelia coarctata]|nr:hypothetical protein [Trapelia coarctata]
MATADILADRYLVLVIGAGPNGLGAALAKLLILTGRSLKKGEAVTNELQLSFPEVTTRALELDLASFDSIHAAVTQVNAYSEPHIDILFNNAGVTNLPTRTLSADGFEMHLAVNYLGAFLFTNGVMGKLLNHDGARNVNISSNGYVFSPFRFADYNFEGMPLPENEQPPKALCEQFGLPWGLGYMPITAYGQSKTAAILYTVKLNSLLNDKCIIAVCVHPGELWRHMPAESVEQILTALPTKSASQGISTPLIAALDPKLKGTACLFLEDCQPGQVLEFASDAVFVDKLWKLSEQLTRKSISW